MPCDHPRGERREGAAHNEAFELHRGGDGPDAIRLCQRIARLQVAGTHQQRDARFGWKPAPICSVTCTGLPVGLAAS